MPSRLVLSWPGCATSASIERSSRPPMAETIERHRRGAGAAVRSVDRDRVVEHFERQAGRRASSRVSTTELAPVSSTIRTRAPLILRRYREITVVGAPDLDRAAVRDDVARHQNDEHAVGDGMQFEAIGIGDHEHEADDDPHQRRRQRFD